MMGDLKKRVSFARLVNYVNNPKKARLIDSKDVRLDDNAAIARSMQGQADDKPGRRLKNPVYHISLDFAHEDTPKLTDELMAEIAREYMRRMGITDTQYVILIRNTSICISWPTGWTIMGTPSATVTMPCGMWRYARLSQGNMVCIFPKERRK